MDMPRSSGVLLHVTSLPGPDGIGDLGQAAFEWVDRLASHRLPLLADTASRPDRLRRFALPVLLCVRRQRICGRIAASAGGGAARARQTWATAPSSRPITSTTAGSFPGSSICSTALSIASSLTIEYAGVPPVRGGMARRLRPLHGAQGPVRRPALGGLAGTATRPPPRAVGAGDGRLSGGGGASRLPAVALPPAVGGGPRGAPTSRDCW